MTGSESTINQKTLDSVETQRLSVNVVRFPGMFWGEPWRSRFAKVNVLTASIRMPTLILINEASQLPPLLCSFLMPCYMYVYL